MYMGKFIRGFFCLILCFVLAASLIASVCLLSLTNMLEEENVDDILKNVSVSDKVFEFEKAEADQEISFGDALRENLPLQNVSLISIYGDSARNATEAGIQAIEEYVASESAITDFGKMAAVFTEAYVANAKEAGKLIGSITYKNIKGERERVAREDYARELVLDRVETDLKAVAESGTAFGKLSLNGKDVICYTARAGKEAAEVENAVYTSIESWYDQLYREYFKGLLNYIVRGDESNGVNGYNFTDGDIANLFITVANNNGIGGKDLDDASAKAEISKQIKDYILPRMKKVISYPYSSWIDDGVVTGMKVTRTIFNMDPRIPLGILCGGLLILMILIGRKMGLGFGCFSALLAGVALLIAPFFRQRALDQMSTELPQEILDLGVNETVVDQLLSFMSRYGFYCLALAGILLLLRLIVQLFSKIAEKKTTRNAEDVNG